MTVTVARRRLLATSAAATVLMLGAFVVGSGALYKAVQSSGQTKRLAGQAQQTAAQTHAALCTFRGDIKSRRDANRAILDAPANRGKPIIDVFGIRIPRNVLQSQVAGQDRTLDSLDERLRCR